MKLALHFNIFYRTCYYSLSVSPHCIRSVSGRDRGRSLLPGPVKDRTGHLGPRSTAGNTIPDAFSWIYIYD